MKSILLIIATLITGVAALSVHKSAPAPIIQNVSNSYDMPKPRDLGSSENQELARLIERRFGVKLAGDLKYRAAGPFRFAGGDQFFYIDRTDTGSVAFERADYGDPYKVRAAALTRDVVMRRIPSAVKGTDLDAPDRRFVEFQDEFAGAAQPKRLPKNFDPRRASTLVARTANFERVEQGVPFFGSEFLIGLNPDGSIGRFRKHWPKVDASIVARAVELQKAVRAGKWRLPDEMRQDDTKIIETTAGVGHSSFAEPGFRAEAVVRVLFRRTAKGTQYPIASTGYRYYTMDGREVHFVRYPELPGSAGKKE